MKFVAVAIALVLAPSLGAQTALPGFEVASVKVAADEDIMSTRPTRTIGHFRWTTTMHYFLEYAYHVEYWRISGDMPDSIYEIDAKTEPKATEDQIRLMLQSLLLERFRMKFHHIDKDAEGYALSVNKGGPKMEEAKEGEMPALPEWLHGTSANPAAMEGSVVALSPAQNVVSIVGRRGSMLQLAERLQRMLDTIVLDQTGLAGAYYFAFRYAAEDGPDTPYPALSTAIKEIGLKIEKHKGPVEMLVIDHMEATPIEN